MRKSRDFINLDIYCSGMLRVGRIHPRGGVRTTGL